MRLIANPKDSINVARSLLAPIIFLSPFYFGLPEGYEVVSAIAIYALIGDTNYVLHLHIHRPFTSNKTANTLLDLSLASVSGMTASNWRIQHLYGHHHGKDLLFRGSPTWELEKFTPLRALSFCFRSIGPTFWRPYLESFRLGILSNVKQPINYRWAFIEHTLLVIFLCLLATVNLKLTLFYVLPLYALTYFISRYVDYLNHYGCDENSDNVYEHSNNCLCPIFNMFTHNFGYHTVHHIRPSAHWTELPELYQQIEDRIPARCKKRFSWSFLLLPYHFYLSGQGKM